MKTTYSMRRPKLLFYVIAISALVWFRLVPGACAATLADFGYQKLKVNGQVPAGTRPLLVILACFDSNNLGTCFGNNFTNGWQYYQDWVFNSARQPVSLNGYFNEVSNGRFSWAPADTELGPGAGVTRVWVNYPGCLECPGVTEVSYFSNIIYQAMGNVDFGNYDANQDGFVTRNELTIAIFNNDWKSGGNRMSGDVTRAGITFRSQGRTVANLGYYATFDTWCHELSHTLGIMDLYGRTCLSYQVTLMSCTGLDVNNRSFHLDPWHKMQLGWSEPRIRSLRTGGVETLPAAQNMDPSAPILLYDPTYGSNDFFILEYRTATSPTGPGYDASVAGNGLVIWHVVQDGYHDPLRVNCDTNGACDFTVWTVGAPNLQKGGNSPWSSGATTAFLQFLPAIPTDTRIHVQPFNLGAGNIVVDWTFPGNSWVDFGFAGFPELGFFLLPFNSLAEGVAAVPVGGVLHVKAGASPAAATLTKSMTIQSYNGPVTIGR